MNAEEAKAYLNANPGALIYDRDGSSWGRDGAQVHTPSGPNSEEWGPFQKEKPGGNESDIQSPAAGRKDDTGKPRISLLPEDVLREMFSTYAYPDDVFQAVHVDRATDIRVSRAAFTLLGRLSTKLGGSRERALGEVVKAFEHGAAKYGDENWRTVEPERYRGAAFRHVFMTEGPDPDSGIDALAHGIASLMILRALQLEAGS